MQFIKFLILPSLFLILLSSCEKESENVFLGTWELAEFRLDCPSEGLDDISVAAVNGCTEFEEEVFCLNLVFETDTEGVFSFGEGGSSSSGQAFKYEYMEASASVNICVEGEDCFLLLFSDDRLVLKESDPECAAEYLLEKN